jgi:hypothetical protein
MTAPTGRRGRISSKRVENVRRQLSDRDRLVLTAVEDLRLLSARQIERAIFVDGSPLTRARRCRAALQRLTEWGCLTRLDRRIGGLRAGSAGFVYGFAPFGQRVLNPGAERLRRVREPRTAFADHVLMISELWVQLLEAEREERLKLIDFQSEPNCWRSSGGVSSVQWVKPDAGVVTATDDWELHFFVEVDLATESQSVIRTKAATYADYWQTGKEQTARGVFPRVLFLVPYERRKEQIVETLSRLPAEQWQLFQVALFDQAVDVMAGADVGQIEGGCRVATRSHHQEEHLVERGEGGNHVHEGTHTQLPTRGR